jgi:hypothetical protein
MNDMSLHELAADELLGLIRSAERNGRPTMDVVTSFLYAYKELDADGAEAAHAVMMEYDL